MSETRQHPFEDDWRECLLAHYRWIVGRQEYKIEATVRELLLKVGVPEARFADIRPALPEPEPEPPAETPPESAPPPPPPKKPQPKQLSFF
jgi:hypothetical protein